MRFGHIFTSVLFGFLFFLPTIQADETLDFFRQFLDKSPGAMNSIVQAVSEKEPVASSASVHSKQAKTQIESVLVAQRIAAPKSAKSAPVPITDPVEAEATSTEKLEVASIYGGRKRNGSAKVSAKEAADAKRMEDQFNKRVSSLQAQLEREEKTLQLKIADFSRRREAALEKSDEAALKKIEALEQAAVASYAQRIEKLIARASAPMNPTGKGAAPVAAKRVSPESRSPATKPLSVQRPVAQRKPYAKRGAVSQQATNRTNQRQQTARPNPNWARSKNAARYNSQVQKQAGQQQRSQQQRAQQQNSQQRNSYKGSASEPQKPKKRRFKLWPFR